MFTPQLKQSAILQTVEPKNTTNEGSLTKADVDRAEAEISSWVGYQSTPLINLPGYAEQLGLRKIYYKDEGSRFGLGSFKALGGAYAVLCSIQRSLIESERYDVSLEDIQNGVYARQISDMTVISATDGNHGRSVAWGAQRLGAKCRIYIHAEVSEFRADAMRALDAEVIRVNADYDATVAQTRLDAEQHGWKIVSDTSWPGYTRAPRDVMAGYGIMAREIARELKEPPTHVFLQGGVGGLAASIISVFHHVWGANAPINIVVEPELAPCLFVSAKAKALTSIKVEEETLMAGLSCGEPSLLAWEIIEQTANGFMTIPESLVAPAVYALAKGKTGDPKIEAGESAVAGFIGLICAASDPDMRDKLKLDHHSRALVIGSEGVTDPHVFSAIMCGEI